jgi:hypothetical protein
VLNSPGLLGTARMGLALYIADSIKPRLTTLFD